MGEVGRKSGGVRLAVTSRRGSIRKPPVIFVTTSAQGGNVSIIKRCGDARAPSCFRSARSRTMPSYFIWVVRSDCLRELIPPSPRADSPQPRNHAFSPKTKRLRSPRSARVRQILRTVVTQVRMCRKDYKTKVIMSRKRAFFGPSFFSS